MKTQRCIPLDATTHFCRRPSACNCWCHDFSRVRIYKGKELVRDEAPDLSTPKNQKGNPGMKKRFLAIALAIAALSVTLPADAATAYMLNFTQFNPYGRYAVAGPFDTLSECQAVERQQTFQPGGSYSCDMIYY